MPKDGLYGHIHTGSHPESGVPPFRYSVDAGPEAIQGLEQPNYFYWGQDEPFATTQFAEKLVRGMKNGQIDFIPKSGHLPWFDDPLGAATRVRNFCQAH